MKKTVRNLLLIVVAVLLIAAFAGCNEKETPVATSTLQVNTIKFMPYAYLDESFDLRDVLLMEEGVDYSATACYVEVKQDEATKEFTITEAALEVIDLCFTPKAIAENVITITAKRGNESASKVIYIPTTIHAEPLDDLYKSSGTLGGSDPGISKSVNIDPMYLYGENSTTSLHVEWNSMDPHPWGNIFLSFSAEAAQEHFTDKKWENAIVTFWVYNPNELPIEFQLRLVDEKTGANIDFSGTPGANSQKALPGQWTQCFFPLRKIGGTTNRLTGTKYSNDMLTLKFRYDGYNTTETYSFDFYMDNIDVVDASMYPEIDTKNVRSNETLEQGWENLGQDIGWQGVYTEYDHEVAMGEGSTCALMCSFDTDKGLTNSFLCLHTETNEAFNGNLDMTAGKLSGYFKFENMDAKISLDIVNKKWETSNKADFKLTPVEDGWYYAEINLEDIEVGNYRNDNIIRIRFHFYGVSRDSVVYVDTLKFDYKHIEKVFEEVSADWINMAMDTGTFYSAGEKSFSTSYLKGGNTVRSLMLKAPADAIGKMTWNTAAAASAGEISAEPNMNYGTLGAWFYFGNQLPNANLVITNDAWKGSNTLPFVFTQNAGDGWYYGEINGSDLTCAEGGGTSKIIRMMLQIPKGYTIYIDNLKWTAGVEKELIAAEIDPSVLYDGGDMLSDVNNIVYDKRHWENVENTDDFDKDGNIDADLTTGLTCGVSTDKVYGPYSVRSWYFKASADNKFGAAVAQLPLSKAYDMTGKNLSFDILVDTDCKFQQPIQFRLQTKGTWSNVNEINPVIKVNPGEWKHVVISFDEVALNPELLKQIGFISITFDFSATTGFERTIYIDNVLIADEEVTAPEAPLVKGDVTENDWTNMVQDVGDFYKNAVVSEIDTSMHYGEESIKSLHIVAPEDKEGMITFNPDYAVSRGDLPAHPCVNEGMISAWFYFGDQEPAAELRITDKAWKGSMDVPFIFNEEPVDGWYYGKLNCASITYSEINNPEYAIRITLMIPAGYDIYVDNMTFDPTPVVMGPEWLYDGGDMLANASVVWNPDEWDGDPFTYDNASAEVYAGNEMGAYSVKSWKLSTEKTVEGTAGIQLNMYTKYDLTNKNIEFDAKFVNAVQTVGIELWNNWSGLQPDVTNLFTVTGNGSDDWQTFTISAEEVAAALEGKTHDQVMVIRFNVDFRTGVEGEHAVYIDNLRFTQSDLGEQKSDLLGKATAEGEEWTEENGLSFAKDEENITGDFSTRSWLFEAAAAAETVSTVKFDLGEDVDMTGKFLIMDAKTNAEQILAVQLLDDEGKELTVAALTKVDSEDWEIALFAVSQLVNEDCDLSAVRSIVFTFDYVTNTGADRAMNIDNIRLVDEETAEQDMIQLPILILPEAVQPELYLSGEYVADESSVASVKLVSPAEEIGGILYDVSSLNLMHRGTISAWFYFGEQAPAGTVGTIDMNAEVSSELEITFGENQDGWYLGQVSLADMVYAEDVVPGNIAVFGLMFPQGYTVYIDMMSYTDITETAADDMIHMLSGTTATLGSDKVHGNMSVTSLFAAAASAAKNMDFVPASALNFADGKITAWFYFGDATPSTVRFVGYSGSSNTGYVTFTFGEGVDGWYLGTADMGDVAAAKQGLLSSIDKFRIQVAKGADVYIDELIFTAN